jgi:hypothetical protein
VQRPAPHAHNGKVPEEVRPWWGRVLTIVVAVICAGMTLSVGITGDWSDAGLMAPWTGLLVLLCWATFWRPRVVVSDGGVRLVNVSRTIDIPWPALRAIETRWALTLVTTYGRFTAWSAPAPGARSVLLSRSGTRREAPPGADDTVRAADLLDTPSGEAAALVHRRWTALRTAGHLDDPRLERERATVHWHVGLALAVVALVAAGVLTSL